MSLNEFFDFGVSRTLGAHSFQAGEIKAFAAKFDPQPFHMDEDAARNSVFGGL
jgi:acyl dehydratase